MTLRLHHAPMACSLASRLALVEAGLPRRVAIVRTWNGEQKTKAYRRINPRGEVPALETDRGVITESTAILPYIADLAPEKALLPRAGTFERAQAQSWLSYLSSTLHVALSAAMFPMDGCDEEAAKRASLGCVIQTYTELDQHLAARDHVLDDFSVCDFYLLVFLLWRAAPAVAGQLTPFSNPDRFQQNLFAERPNLAMMVGEEMKLRSEAG